MTPRQMLSRAPAAPPPPQETPPKVYDPHRRNAVDSSGSDHAIRVVSPPANGGRKLTLETVEPWILEQLKLLACPTCGEHLLHMISGQYAPDTHFYVCEDNPVEHRWTLVE